MFRINRMFTVLLLTALLLSACQPILPPDTVTPSATVTTGVAHSPRPDAPTYALRGPYAVGVRDFVIEGVGDERQVAVSVWYPALNSDGRSEAIIYELDFPTNESPLFTVAGSAIRDAEPDRSGGPYPLLLHAHAAWSLRQEAAYWVEHLASHGFVVIAPAFEDNWGMIFASVPTSEISRPHDAIRTLDFAETLTAAGGVLEGLVDLEHVAASGWSWGGQVALEMAGARIDINDWLATYCQEYPDVTDCGVYPDHLQEMAELAGLERVPDGLWPDWRDSRVDAVVALAPAVSMFGGGGLDAVQVPVMLMVGSADSSVGPEFAFRQTFETLPSEAKTRVIFAGADHTLFFNSCTVQPAMAEAGYAGVCSDPVWDMNRAHDLVNHFATAFLLAELKGDAEAAAALAPDNVAFPGIQYATTAYAAPPTTETVAPPPNIAEIEALIQKAMIENEIPGMALGIVSDGEIVYTNAFGVERVGTATPVTLHSIFGTGAKFSNFFEWTIELRPGEAKDTIVASVVKHRGWAKTEKFSAELEYTHFGRERPELAHELQTFKFYPAPLERAAEKRAAAVTEVLLAVLAELAAGKELNQKQLLAATMAKYEESTGESIGDKTVRGEINEMVNANILLERRTGKRRPVFYRLA